MRNLLLSIFALFFVLNTAQSQQKFTLKQALDYAEKNNTSVKIAQLGVSDAEQQIVENRAIGLPKLSANVNYQHFLQLPISLVPAEFFGGQPGEFAELQFGVKNNLTTSLEFSSLIVDASYLTALKASREYRVLTSKQLALAKQDVRKSVTLTFLATLIYDESAKTIENNLKSIERLLFETKELYESGFAEQLDVDRLELSVSNLTAQQEDLERQKEVAINNLKFIMGYPLDQPIEIMETLENMVNEGFATEVNEPLALNNRMEYQVLQSTINLQELNVKAQREAGYYPNLAAFGSYQQSLQKNDLFEGTNNWFPTAVVGLQLNIPIFDGLAREAKIQRAKLDLEEATRQREQLVKSIQLEVENARIEYRRAVAKVSNEKKNITLAEKIFKTAQIKYKEGIGSSIELIQAEQSLYQYQSSYISALFNLLLSKANLEVALGKQ